MISWAVVGHEARIVQATELAKALDAPASIDDGTLGADRNHLRAWTLHQDATWHGVMEDDAVPVDGFTDQAEQALAVAPEPVVSFYLGRGRPVRWQQERVSVAVALAEQQDPHWFTCTHLLHAVAVAIHGDLVEDWLDWAHTSTLPIDERITAWCLTRDHRVAYSWPSLVDHADGPSLVRHSTGNPGAGPRIAWRTGTRHTWTPAATRM